MARTKLQRESDLVFDWVEIITGNGVSCDTHYPGEYKFLDKHLDKYTAIGEMLAKM
jgi:hypothetical protein